MMASDRPAGDNPQPVSIPLPPIPAPTTSAAPTLQPSGFLNSLDIFQSAGLVLFAFLIASFAVRNSDFFQHIAAGRLIASGEYSFGKDPFSFTTEGHNWVNHAWLFDFGIYQIYTKLGGAGVVIFKGLLIAGLAAVLLLTRRPTQSLWFAIVGIGLALLATAPRLVMQPTLMSYFFLGLTLCLFTRLTGPRHRKSLPIAMGVVCCLWSNCDQWFIVGPFVAGVYLLAAILPPIFRDGNSGDRLSLGTIFATLLATVLGSMVNPHHIHVWQLPPELFGGPIEEILQSDRELKSLFYGVFSPEVFNLTGSARIANPANSFALLLLTGLTILSFLFNLLYLRWQHIILWVAVVFSAMTHYRTIGFYCIVSAVVTTWNFGAFSERVKTRHLSEGMIRLFLMIRGMGRTISLLAGLLLILMVRPGWLNQQPKDRLNARWLTWEVQADESQVLPAQTLQKWRDEGKLPPEGRGLILQIDFGNFVSWYAPKEKNFFDLRFALHEDHAAEFVLLRDWLRGDLEKEKEKLAKVRALFDKYNITHLVLAANDRGENFEQAQRLLLEYPFKSDWELWHLEGRVWIFGRKSQKAMSQEQFDRLLFDPIPPTYRFDIPTVDEPQTLAPYGVSGWLENYWDPPVRPAPQSDESFSVWAYQQIMLQREVNRIGFVQQNLPALTGHALPASLMLRTDDMTACVLRSIRLARQAVSANPDSPDAYLALARGYATDFPTLPEFGSRMLLANLQRGLARATPESAPNYLRVEMFLWLQRLAESHREARPARIDLLVETIEMANEYLKYPTVTLTQEKMQEAIQIMARPFGAKGISPRDLRDRIMTEYENATNGLEDGYTRALIAKQMGLFREARDVLLSINLEVPDVADDPVRAAVELDLIDLDLTVGQVEAAYDRIRKVEKRFGDRGSDPKFRAEYSRIRGLVHNQLQRRLGVFVPYDPEFTRKFRETKVAVCFLAGKLTEAIQEHEIMLLDLERALKAGNINLDLLERMKKMPEPQVLDNFSIAIQFLGAHRSALHYFAMLELQGMAVEGFSRTRTELQIVESVHIIHLRQALINLEKGNNREALFHFEQAAKPVGIDYPFQSIRIVNEYLRSLKRANPDSK